VSTAKNQTARAGGGPVYPCDTPPTRPAPRARSVQEWSTVLDCIEIFIRLIRERDAVRVLEGLAGLHESLK
jgi:hypothetical protein